MTDLNHYDGENRYGQNGHRRCRSSFWIHDPEQVFSELNLREGDCFLDMGCGSGDYAIRASEIVGNSGKVFALDRWQDGIDDLTEKAGSLRLNNLRAIAADITAPLPIEDGSIDVCFLATVLHIFK
ncbi:MAG: methyltransferase domain-containing protein, partial [Methanosarcinales archaeon]|nr:methyltransferase domain-containing protein [Methanosarcinales archaeon]